MEFTIEKNDALNFLEDNPLGTLATIRPDGRADLAVIYFYVKKDFSCCFVTKVLTRKYKNILTAPHATLLVHNEKELTSVEITGSVEVMRDTIAIAQAIEEFNRVVASRRVEEYWAPPISQMSAGQYAVCKLVPDTVRSCRFKVPGADVDVPLCRSFTLSH